jgi:hypothetical protein
MSVWDAEDQEGCDRVEAIKKWGEAGLIHWLYGVDGVPKLVCTKVTGEADPCDRPKKIRSELFFSTMLHHYDDYKEARSSSWPYVDCKVAQTNEKNELAGPYDRPNPFTSYPSFICSVDLMDEGKLGYGFTSADELEEINIGPGDKPRPTFISKKLNPELREPMIVLLKEYADCFAWDYCGRTV